MFYVSAKIGLNRNDIEKVTTITAFFESFVPSVKILVKSDSMFTLACEQVLHVLVSQSKR